MTVANINYSELFYFSDKKMAIFREMRGLVRIFSRVSANVNKREETWSSELKRQNKISLSFASTSNKMSEEAGKESASDLDLSSPDWFVACDDPVVYENNAKGSLKADAWRPPSADVVTLYATLTSMNGTLPLTWSWPNGRRPPSPKEDEEYETDEEESKDEGEKVAENAMEEEKKAEFEFDEDFGDNSSSSLQGMRKNKDSELRGSARKKTTDLSAILSNMKRHRQMDAANRAKQNQH